MKKRTLFSRASTLQQHTQEKVINATTRRKLKPLGLAESRRRKALNKRRGSYNVPAIIEQLEDRTLLSITVGIDDANSLEQPQFLPGEILAGL